MSFDPFSFEAEVALKLVPTERLPIVAQDALEAGFDGPHVVRMAILDPRYGWAIDRALPPMLDELGLHSISPEEAALRLAHLRARRILMTGEDPLLSTSYFYRLWLASDYLSELTEVANFDDYDVFFGDDHEKLARAREALEELLSPELRLKRSLERTAKWEQEQTRVRSEWPYVLNSPSGRALLKARYIERISELRPLLWIEAVAWGLLGWAFSSWRTTVIGYIGSMPVLFALPAWGVYLKMKRERRNTLLRRGVPDNEI